MDFNAFTFYILFTLYCLINLNSLLLLSVPIMEQQKHGPFNGREGGGFFWLF